MMMQQVITPVSKMMDGLFVGSREASQDLDFITTNKITAIINCAGGTVPNALVRVSE